MGSERHVALAVAFALATVVIAGAGLATADPPDDSDHGVNETTFTLLWSGDEDDNLNSEGSGDSESSAMRQLASGEVGDRSRVLTAVCSTHHSTRGTGSSAG